MLARQTGCVLRINAESASGSSSGLIRDQRVFNPGDLVFEQQFALLEALEHQLIGPDIGLQALDRRIQVAMFLPQHGHALGQAGLFCRIQGLAH